MSVGDARFSVVVDGDEVRVEAEGLGPGQALSFLATTLPVLSLPPQASPGDINSVVLLSDIEQRVLAFIQGRGSCSAADVQRSVNGRTNALRDALEALVEYGLVRRRAGNAGVSAYEVV